MLSGGQRQYDGAGALFPGERCRYHGAGDAFMGGFSFGMLQGWIFLIADFLLTAARHFAVRK